MRLSLIINAHHIVINGFYSDDNRLGGLFVTVGQRIRKFVLAKEVFRRHVGHAVVFVQGSRAVRWVGKRNDLRRLTATQHNVVFQDEERNGRVFCRRYGIGLGVELAGHIIDDDLDRGLHAFSAVAHFILKRIAAAEKRVRRVAHLTGGVNLFQRAVRSLFDNADNQFVTVHIAVITEQVILDGRVLLCFDAVISGDGRVVDGIDQHAHRCTRGELPIGYFILKRIRAVGIFFWRVAHVAAQNRHGAFRRRSQFNDG